MEQYDMRYALEVVQHDVHEYEAIIESWLFGGWQPYSITDIWYPSMPLKQYWNNTTRRMILWGWRCGVNASTWMWSSMLEWAQFEQPRGITSDMMDINDATINIDDLWIKLMSSGRQYEVSRHWTKYHQSKRQAAPTGGWWWLWWLWTMHQSQIWWRMNDSTLGAVERVGIVTW